MTGLTAAGRTTILGETYPTTTEDLVDTIAPDDSFDGDKRRRNQQILALRRQGKSLREIANIVGLSHETVALVCRKNGLGRITLAQARALDATQRERIVEAWREGESPKSIAQREGVYIATVGRVVEQDATERDKEARRILINTRRPQRKRIADETIYAAVRKCGDALGRMPTTAEYRTFAQENGLPSGPTIQKRMGWRAALVGAGYEPRYGRGRGPAFTEDECWNAVRATRDELGRVPSIAEYERLRGHRNDQPGAQTVRSRCGGWTRVATVLHDELMREDDAYGFPAAEIPTYAPEGDPALSVAKQKQRKKWWKR